MSYVGERRIDFQFAINDPVFIDGCESIKGLVIGMTVAPHSLSYKVSWWDGGVSRSEWFEEFRLKLAA